MNHSPRWQFSLFTLLALTAVVAATAGAVTSPPNWFSGLTLGFLSFAFPVGFTLVIVYGEGYWRAFCIGALAPSLECWIMSGLAVLWITVETFVTSSGMATAVVPTPTGPVTYTTTVTSGEFDVPDASDPAAISGDDTGVRPAVFEDPAANPAIAPSPPAGPAAGTSASTFTLAPAPPGTMTGSYGVDYAAIPLLAESFARIYRVGGALYWTFAVVLGSFAVFVRWLIERAKVRRALGVR
jgi:hypothetical protein